MGLIAALKQFFDPGLSRAETAGPRIADLLYREKAALDRAVIGAPYELLEEDRGSCRVVTDRFTLTFGWWWRDQWINADLSLHEAPGLPFEMHVEYSARNWLEALRLPPPPRRAGGPWPDLLRDELEAVHQVVAHILSDERKTRQALFYLHGSMMGYNDRFLVPEEAPPRVVTRWTEERLRASGRPVKGRRD